LGTIALIGGVLYFSGALDGLLGSKPKRKKDTGLAGAPEPLLYKPRTDAFAGLSGVGCSCQSLKGPEDCYATYVPIADIYTDPARFQNRTDAFSEVSADAVAQYYDPNKFDPIVVWRDPANQRIYVLSGHSRYEGMKRWGEATIPARFFRGSESEAVQFARVDANRAATPESFVEDLKAFRLMRDGDTARGLKPVTKAELSRKFKGRNHKLEAYSYLNPNGLFIKALSEEDRSLYPFIEIKALWVGELRKEFPEMTNLHEQDIFWFIYGDKAHLRLDKDSFENEIKKRIAWGKERLFPECGSAGCDDLNDLSERGPNVAAYKRLHDLQAFREDLNSRFRTTRPSQKVYTDNERDFLRDLARDWEAEAEEIRRRLNIEEARPGLFGLDWQKVMSGAEVVKVLLDNGWHIRNTRGSHVNMAKGSHRVTVPLHKELAKGTLHEIKKKANEANQ